MMSVVLVHSHIETIPPEDEWSDTWFLVRIRTDVDTASRMAICARAVEMFGRPMPASKAVAPFANFLGAMAQSRYETGLDFVKFLRREDAEAFADKFAEAA